MWLALLVVPGFIAIDAARHYEPTDFRCFYTAARMVQQQRDPYDPVSWSEAIGPGPARDGAGVVRPSSCPGRFAYPLWTALVLVPLAYLPIATAATIWMLALVAGVAFGSVRLWHAAVPEPRSPLVFAALVFTSQPLWFTLEVAQFGGLMLGLIGLTLWLASKRHALAGLPLALLVLKPHVTFLTIGAMCIWLTRHVRGAAVLAGTLGLALVVTSIAIRPNWIAGWLVEIGGPERLANTASHTTVWHLAPLLGLPAWTAVFLIAPLLVLLVRELTRSKGLVIDVVAVSGVCGLLVSPYQGSYDQLILVAAWGRALAIGLARTGLIRAGLLVGVVAAASLLPWTLRAIALQSRQDETPNAIALVATAAVLCAALRATRRAAEASVARSRLAAGARKSRPAVGSGDSVVA